MNQDTFWTLIEESKARSSGFSEHSNLLKEMLKARSPSEIESYQAIFDELYHAAYRWELWGAAYVIGSGCSDDGFADFRSWLISMGRERYDAALENPESLSSVIFGAEGEEDSFFEEFASVGLRAYEEATGDELEAVGVGHPEDPLGARWNEEDLEQLYPELWRLHWAQ